MNKYINNVEITAGANLRNMNLRSANLQNADLRNADLQGADLRGANSPQVLIISGSKHAIIAIRGDAKVSVGCERRKIAAWLAKYRRIGCQRGYSDTEVAEYGLLLRCVQAVFRSGCHVSQ